VPFIASAYKAPFGFGNGDLQTVYPTLFRRLPPLPYRRETLMMMDGDYLDLDWLCHDSSSEKKPGAASPGNPPLAVLAHGMEGKSDAIYMRGMARCLFAAGFDILAWNMRGCGGRPNLKPHFYHSGKTEDLREVLAHATQSHARYALVGFSLGGNVVLKHLGEIGKDAEQAPAPTLPIRKSGLIGAVAISVPVDLQACATRLAHPRNYIYQKRFLLSFRAKLRAKMLASPGTVSDAAFRGTRRIRSILDFDNAYTAPDFGYPDAETYWAANASLGYLRRIQSPTLMLSSLDDPFLSPSCHPRDLSESHPCLHYEQSLMGGHCGFIEFNTERAYYSESRARDFLLSQL
jgi:uncharacterized protein